MHIKEFNLEGFAAWKPFLAESLDSRRWLITVNHVVESSKMPAWCNDSALVDFGYFPEILLFPTTLHLWFSLFRH